MPSLLNTVFKHQRDQLDWYGPEESGRTPQPTAAGWWIKGGESQQILVPRCPYQWRSIFIIEHGRTIKGSMKVALFPEEIVKSTWDPPKLLLLYSWEHFILYQYQLYLFTPIPQYNLHLIIPFTSLPHTSVSVTPLHYLYLSITNLIFLTPHY